MKKKQILLLIAGCISLATTITGLIMIIIGIGVYGATFVVGLYMFAISVIICIPCLADAHRLFKSTKHDIEQKQEYSNEQANNSTENNDMIEVIKDIVVETIEQNTSTDKSEEKYCTNCGCAIDKNSNFCKICGKEQD